jgi:hypothetical protein
MIVRNYIKKRGGRRKKRAGTRAGRSCDFPFKINMPRGYRAVRDGTFAPYRGSPLPHPPQSLESLGWACFGPQNLDVKELTYQNLDNKGLRGGTMRVHPTVTTSTMITRFSVWRKVRCHTGAVEKFGSERRSEVVVLGPVSPPENWEARRRVHPCFSVACLSDRVGSYYESLRCLSTAGTSHI